MTKDDLFAYKQQLVSPTDTSFEPWDGTAFWTDSGSVWHKDKSCSYLSKAKPEEIHTGTADEALAAGKERACSRCAK